MTTKIPYMMSVKNLPDILKAIQQAATPSTFNLDFLRDLGFKSSSDRGIIKMLKYLGMLDESGIPKEPYRDFVDQTRGKRVLADRLKYAYHDLFVANPTAHQSQQQQLKGWFKSKTGESDSVAQKIAMTFRHLAKYADFDAVGSTSEDTISHQEDRSSLAKQVDAGIGEDLTTKKEYDNVPMTLTYRLEVNLPNSTDFRVYRAIFKALREELMS